MTFKAHLNSFIGKQSVQYLIFWVISFVFLVNYFTKGTDIGRIDIIYTLLFHISIIYPVSVNSFLLIPRFLASHKYTLYFVGLVLLLGTSVWLNLFTFKSLSDWLFPGYYFISYLQWWEILEFVIVYVGLTSLLEFSKSWFKEIEMEKKMETLQKEKVETELKVLRAQINPHFLFNSLNHIYVLATRQAPETAGAVLQLSELLRYALKQMDKQQAPLEDEVEYIRKYIALYKRRLHHPERVRFSTEGDFTGRSIAPLLLIVFIENCFKHGSVERPEESIRIHIARRDGKLLLNTSNTIDRRRNLPADTGGVGLDNVRRRLELLYPDTYRLHIDLNEDKFETELELELT